MVVNKKQASAQLTTMKKELQTPKKQEEEKKAIESDDEDDDDEDDDEVDDIDEDEEDDDEEDDDEDDEEDEDEDDDDDDDDDEDEEEEEEANMKKGLKLVKGKQMGKTPEKGPKGVPPQGPSNKFQTPKAGKYPPGPATATPKAKTPMKVEKPALTKAAAMPLQPPLSAKAKVGMAEKRKQETPTTQNDAKRQKTGNLTDENLELELKRRRERDRKSLFVRGLPVTITEDDIRTWSPDIIDVRIPSKGQKQRRKAVNLYAFLEFVNEKKAEENFAFLKNKKINGIEVDVDYAGEKSTRAAKFKKEGKPILPIRPINKQMLYVAGIPVGTTMEDMARAFPDAIEISMGKGPNTILNRSAHVSFETADAAEAAFKRGGSIKVKGSAITVLYAFAKNKKKKPSEGKKKHPKERKLIQPIPIKKEESDDDDDDDDEDDDDDDDSG